jgi:IS30 family transposase
MNRHHSTIARELSRNNNANYSCETAQEAYHHRRLSSKPKGKCSPELVADIERTLEATWSPEQISHTITKGKLRFKTIYRWLYSGKVSKGNMKVLRHKGKRHKPAEKRGKFIIGTSIHQRPKEVKSRGTFEHWELDTVVSSRGESKGCFATFVERKTRLYTAFKIADRTAYSMEGAIKHLHAALPNNAFKTATVDRGKEFAYYKNIENDIGLPLLFADPYSSWQRGSNENSNGLLREFYPKKTNLALADEKKLMNNLFLINSRPRKCLGWKSPIRIFLHELSHLT